MMSRPIERNEVRSNLRRSQRVHAQLPVVVQGKLTDETSFADPTRAIVLSAHGCLITLSASVRLGESLILRNIAACHSQKLSWLVISEVSRAQRRDVPDQSSRGRILPRKTELRIANEHTARPALSREHLEIVLDQAALRV
jgi:hypothetical protein